MLMEEKDVHILYEQQDVPTVEEVDVIEVDDVSTYEVDTFNAFPAVGERNENVLRKIRNNLRASKEECTINFTSQNQGCKAQNYCSLVRCFSLKYSNSKS